VAPHINEDLTPYSVFTFYFAADITLLVEKTSQYYQYSDFLDNGHSPVPDMATIIQMGHDIHDNLKD
jgi:hypothetical protein